jgi:hypothetical protein
MLSAAIVEELEQVWVCCCWRNYILYLRYRFLSSKLQTFLSFVTVALLSFDQSPVQQQRRRQRYAQNHVPLLLPHSMPSIYVAIWKIRDIAISSKKRWLNIQHTQRLQKSYLNRRLAVLLYPR